MIPGSLNARQRELDLDQLASGADVDVLVVGGGVTGAGAALDAASRGLSVALIEATDLAFGTSRWSSKLVHGGLRYLAKAGVALAHESALERGTLMTRTAPHLTKALPQLIPLYTTTTRRRQAFMLAGLHSGDTLRRIARTPTSVLPAPRDISTAEAMALAPGLGRDNIRGALLSFDGALTDDARLVIALARTARSFGARILTRLRATELSATGARARDELSGQHVDLRAKQVINATGVWAGRLDNSVRLRPSRGSHLVLRAGTGGLVSTSVLVPVPGEGNRFVLLLPQPDGRIYLGLTDEPIADDFPDTPEVPESDVDFLLDVASSALAHELTTDDVVGSFAGLRPLIESAPGRGARQVSSADLSRKHAVFTGETGMVTVVGGKLTTYRKMAADAVDAAVQAAGLRAGPCRTDRLPLLGAAPRSRLSTVDAPARLLGKYGTEAPRVAAVGELDPALAEPLFPGCPVTAAEVVWAVRHEGALDADDVLHRRTRLGLVHADAVAAAPRVHELVEKALHGVRGRQGDIASSCSAG